MGHKFCQSCTGQLSVLVVVEMDRRIRDSNSIEELHDVIDQGLNSEENNLALHRLFELVGENEHATSTPDTSSTVAVEEDSSTAEESLNAETGKKESVSDAHGADVIDDDGFPTECEQPCNDMGKTPGQYVMTGGDNPIEENVWAATNEINDRKRPTDNPMREEEPAQKRPAAEPTDDLIKEVPFPFAEDDEKESDKEEEDRPIDHYYSVETVHTKHVKKYKATAKDYRLRLKNLDRRALDALPLLSAIIDEMLKDMTIGVRPRDMVRIILQAPGLDKPIALPFIKKDDLTMDRFMARIEHVLQSKKDLKLNSDMDINFVHMEMPDGGKPTRDSILYTWEEKKKNWYCIIAITNQSDNMCLARAIVTGRAKQELKSTDWEWRSIRDGKTKQRDLAVELHKLAGVPTYAPCGLEQVEAFQNIGEKYQLVVVSKDHLNKIIYQGPPKPKGIYLLYNDRHFDLITSMSAYLNRGYWCHECKKGYDNKPEHRCRDTCMVCRSGNCLMSDEVDEWVRCLDCNRYFKSRACYENHKRSGTSIKKFGNVCKQYFKCEKCETVVNKKMLKKGVKHHCTDLWCMPRLPGFLSRRPQMLHQTGPDPETQRRRQA